MKTLYLVAILAALSSQFLVAESGDVLPIKKGKVLKTINPAISEEKLIEARKKAAQNEVKKGPYVASISVYGTSRMDESQLRSTLGKELEKWLELGLKGDASSLGLEQKLAKKVKDKFGFYSAEWSVIQFFSHEDEAIHIVLDVVENEDVAVRMPFLKAPKGEFKDPDSLIKYWGEYENAALDLVESGQLDPETDTCKGVAFHCPFGHKHEKLKKYQTVFVEGVKKNLDKLVQILNEDKRPEFRAAAAYLLAYHTEGQKIANWMVERIKDPADIVRNNALRVLGDIAEYNPSVILPISPIMQAMDFPRSTDRSKSAFVAHILALNSEAVRDEFRTKGTQILLKLLEAKMPDQREFAHAILRKISGKEYPSTDITAWKGWVSKNAKERH